MKRNKASLFFFSFVFTMLSFVLEVSYDIAHAETLASGRTYVIRSAMNKNYVIDVAGGSRNNGTNIHLWSYHGGTNQQFVISHVRNGYYSIKLKNTNKFETNDGNTEAS